MVPPIRRDEDGQTRPVRPCARCGADTPILRLRAEHLALTGWRPLTVAQYVNWCGHAQEYVPIPTEGGRACWMIPVLGEAS